MHGAKGPVRGEERPIRPAPNRTGMPSPSGAGSQSEKKPGSYGKLGDDPRTLAAMIKQDSTQIYEAKEEPLQNPEA